MPEFVKDLEGIRRRAINKIEEGPVTTAYQLDKDKTVRILNEALATEIVCVLRYMHHYFMATGVHGKSVAAEFKEHADAERNHADALAERIQQLGGKPDYNPGSLVKRSVSQYIEGETLADMIREDLIAERVVIELYTDMIRYFGDKDPTTRVLLEGLLKDEEEHAADLADLLYIVDPHTGETEGQDPGTHPLDLHGGERDERGHRDRELVGTSRAGGQRNIGARSTETRASSQGATRSTEQLNMAGRRGSRNEETSMEHSRSTGGQARAGQARPEVGQSPQGPEQFAGRGTVSQTQAGSRASEADNTSVPPAHAPGTVGHPTRQRTPHAEEIESTEVADEIDEGGQAGSTRSVHVTRPTRKKRIA